jgi:hypothetical protein
MYAEGTRLQVGQGKSTATTLSTYALPGQPARIGPRERGTMANTWGSNYNGCIVVRVHGEPKAPGGDVARQGHCKNVKCGRTRRGQLSLRNPMYPELTSRIDHA